MHNLAAMSTLAVIVPVLSSATRPEQRYSSLAGFNAVTNRDTTPPRAANDRVQLSDDGDEKTA